MKATFNGLPADGGRIRPMDTPEPSTEAKDETSFIRFVRAIAGVPKADVDAEEARAEQKPRIKRGPKPKPAR